MGGGRLHFVDGGRLWFYSLMICRSFSDLPWVAFSPLYGAFVWPHLEYAVEANSQNLLRVQHLATQLMRGLCHVPCEGKLLTGTQTSPRWPHPGLQDFWRFNLPTPIWFLPSSTPNWAEGVHLQDTAGAKPSSMKERYVFCAYCEILEQIAVIPCHPQCLSLKDSWTINGSKSLRN